MTSVPGAASIALTRAIVRPVKRRVILTAILEIGGGIMPQWMISMEGNGLHCFSTSKCKVQQKAQITLII